MKWICLLHFSLNIYFFLNAVDPWQYCLFGNCNWSSGTSSWRDYISRFSYGYPYKMVTSVLFFNFLFLHLPINTRGRCNVWMTVLSWVITIPKWGLDIRLKCLLLLNLVFLSDTESVYQTIIWQSSGSLSWCRIFEIYLVLVSNLSIGLIF